MTAWERKIISTVRGTFEVFIKGAGQPVCVTHYYSEFNETGDQFADTFTDKYRVILVNLREAGQSEKAHEPHELSMLETVFDLEAIRKALEFRQWIFAGHSTGGMLGLIYGIHCSESLLALITVGAAAREYMTFSPFCIYNEAHPEFHRMQELIESLKNPALSVTERKQLVIERTKLSLYRPADYDMLFNPAIHKRMSAKRMNFFNRELQIYDVTRKLELISTPTLVMCGRHDVQCPLDYSIEIADGIQHAALVIFEESNHYPFLEEQSKFKSALAQYL